MYMGVIELRYGEKYKSNNKKTNYKNTSNTENDFMTVLSGQEILHNKIGEMLESFEEEKETA